MSLLLLFHRSAPPPPVVGFRFTTYPRMVAFTTQARPTLTTSERPALTTRPDSREG